MIVEAGNILKGFLEPFLVGGSGDNQFIDKLAGVVKPITKVDLDKDNKPVKKTFPVSCDASLSDCFASGRYKDFIPNSSLGCMVYFEDVANQYLGRDGRKFAWKAQYRLVCWLNQNKLGAAGCSVTSQIITTFISAFPENPFNSGIFQRGEVSVLAQDPKSFNPFAKYSYDEEKTQFLMHPFDYFSLQIEYKYMLDKACFTPFTKNEEINC